MCVSLYLEICLVDVLTIRTNRLPNGICTAGAKETIKKQCVYCRATGKKRLAIGQTSVNFCNSRALSSSTVVAAHRGLSSWSHFTHNRDCARQKVITFLHRSDLQLYVSVFLLYREFVRECFAARPRRRRIQFGIELTSCCAEFLYKKKNTFCGLWKKGFFLNLCPACFCFFFTFRF